MAYEFVETEDGWKQVIIPDSTDNPQKLPAAQITPQVFPQRPMLLQMPLLQQPNQMPFPLLFFLFPRLAMLLMMQRGGQGWGRTGIQHITQLIRDKEGRIIEILEYMK